VRVLLDECVPKRFGAALTGHLVQTAAQAGLAGLKNGELLRAASEAFDCFVTVDRNLQFQQNPTALPLAVIVVVAKSNRLEALLEHASDVVRAIEETKTGTLRVVGA
jgi:predicted nuclease of predicted toxin-antitoxin system